MNRWVGIYGCRFSAQKREILETERKTSTGGGFGKISQPTEMGLKWKIAGFCFYVMSHLM